MIRVYRERQRCQCSSIIHAIAMTGGYCRIGQSSSKQQTLSFVFPHPPDLCTKAGALQAPCTSSMLCVGASIMFYVVGHMEMILKMWCSVKEANKPLDLSTEESLIDPATQCSAQDLHTSQDGLQFQVPINKSCDVVLTSLDVVM